MKTTIVLAHPWHGSFNKAILDTITNRLDVRSKEYQIIDLNKDNFDPVLREHDLALYSKEQSTDEMVLKYQDMLKNSDELTFIFPIWWYDMPAILKGFMDKVMLKDFAYVETKTGLKGLLTHIKQTNVITTSEVPNWYLRLIGGNFMKRPFIKATLKGIGLKKVRWTNSEFTTSGKRERKEKFLKKVESIY